MEEEKNYIFTRAFNSLKKHAELIEETKDFVKVYAIRYLLFIKNSGGFTNLIINELCNIFLIVLLFLVYKLK